MPLNEQSQLDYFIQMYGVGGFSKKVIRQREEGKHRQGHLERIRNARPTTTGWQLDDGRRLNNAKKNMIVQNKFTEIQRENRLLLEKITTNMNKRAQSVTEGERQNKSLHGSFRKKQLQNIEIENARLLKRLQDKRSDYDVDRLKEDWKKQKAVIKNIANYPFVIKDGSKRRRGSTKPINLGYDRPANDEVEMVRLLKLDGVSMLVTIRLNQTQLVITGDLQTEKQVKLIQIPREQAIEFIQYECQGRVQNLFDRLRFDTEEKVLYLLSKEVDYEKLEKQQQKLE